MSSVLVVFHTRSGHSRMVAETLSHVHGWGLGELAYATGGQAYARCARDALLRRAPPVRYTGPDPEDFAAVVLVSPIWCGRLSPPMRRFLADRAGRLPAVAVVSCMGGSGASDAVAEVEQLVRRRAVATLALCEADVEAGRQAGPLRQFALCVTAGLGGAPTQASPLRAVA